MENVLLLLLTNAVQGREDEFNDWYTNVHLPDVLKMPGVISAKRYKLGEQQRMHPPYPFRYMAIYEVEPDHVATVIEELRTRPGTDVMPLSPAMQEYRLSYFFDPIAELHRD